jgi:SnoaL-like domain
MPDSAVSLFYSQSYNILGNVSACHKSWGFFMNEKFMKSYYWVYNSEDPASLEDFYHRDVELTSAQGIIKGIDALLATYRDLISNFYDRMTPCYIAFEGSSAVVNILDRFTAKHDVENFMGVSLAAGESFSLHLRGTYEFLDDKIRKIIIEQTN